jgi:energy-coupling factor transporter ATP-binding protein EcfA2
MSINFKYKFEQNGQKGDCPQCGKRGVFRHYEGLPREFGKCERLNNCGYHNKPDASIKPAEVPQPVEKPQLYVDALKVEAWQNNISSPFHVWAKSLGLTEEHLKKWNVGTSDKGETVFIHQNHKSEFWNAKFIAYTEGGSRKKDKDAYYLRHPKEGKYLICLFGEHLLGVDTSRRVCIVESEKTAVIASFFYPDFDFIACGANTGLTDSKIGVLVGRSVFNLRDADIAGRSTCNAAKMEKNGCTTFCQKCALPHIEQRLFQWKIDFIGVDMFPEHTDGYDLADAIRDGEQPNIFEIALRFGYKHKVEIIEEEKMDLEPDWAWKLPKGISFEEVEKYGFYEFKDKYYMRRIVKEIITFSEISNFTMKILFLIQGTNAKRIVQLKNDEGKVVTLDFNIDELISIDKFRLKIESNGVFLFRGTNMDLMRIKQKIFSLEKASAQVSFAGHHKDQFYIFSNGIFDYNTNAFVELNEHKMVDLDGRHYFVPLLEDNGDDEENGNYKAFQHRSSTHNFKAWSKLFSDVYGDNGKVGLAFSIMAIFLDVVKESTVGKYPLLFLFGQKGSGKTTMAKSLGCLFGERKEPPKLEGKSTTKSYARQLAQLSNSLLVFDEYKNTIDIGLIGMLKGWHDGSGYNRSKMDNTNKTVSTPVRSTGIVGGQEMPNVEPALFSRFLLLEFQTLKNVHQKQLDNYDKLTSMEDESITSVLLEILKHRKYFQDNYHKNYLEVRALLRKAYTGSETIDRQILIGAAIIAAAKTAQEVLPMPFTWQAVQNQVEIAITRQTQLMNTADEVQEFFTTIALMLRQGQIKDELDIRFKDLVFTQQGENSVNYTDGWLLIRMKNVYPIYRERLIRQNLKPLDAGTLERYLKSSSAYDSKASTGSHRFKSLQNPTNALCFLQKQVVELYKIDLTDYTPQTT